MEPIRVAEKYFSAWNQRNADAVVASFTDEGTYTDPLADHLRGRAIASYAAGLWQAFPDLTFEIVDPVVAAGSLVAARWIMRGTNTGSFQGLPPTGKPAILPGVDFVRVEGDRIAAVQGFFDTAEVPRALGLDIVVQPQRLGPFQFGTSVAAAAAGDTRAPGAFTITSIDVRDGGEVERVRQAGREIVLQMRGLPGFMGFVGVTIGTRMRTITAWESPQRAHDAAKVSVHVEAMRQVLSGGLGTGGFTSVWTPERINRRWRRCPACAAMVDAERSDLACACAAPLPPHTTYW